MLREKVTNIGDEHMEFMWGHHPTFGWPFLEEGSEICLPDCNVIVPSSEIPATSRLVEQQAKWPYVKGKHGETVDLSIMPAPEMRAHDMVFLSGFTQSWYTIRNPRLRLEFRLCWDKSVFRYLWFWQVTRGAYGYPWYGTTYNLALEPHSSYPPLLPRAIDSGTQLRLEAGHELATELEAKIILT